MNELNREIKIAIVPGSMRPGSNTVNAVRLIEKELKERPNVDINLIDISGIDFPFPGQKKESRELSEFKRILREADAVILATPEYHGSYSSLIKLSIENMDYPSLISGKPVALVGVASGSIGAVKSIEALRGVCAHVGSIVLPGPVSIANADKVFDDRGECMDIKIAERLIKLADNLINYTIRHVCPPSAFENMVRENS